MDVSIHEPQLQPPPASGDSNNPCAGMVLNQQSGRNLSQLVVLQSCKPQTVTLLSRKNSALVVAA